MVVAVILLAGLGGALGFEQGESDAAEATWRVRESAVFITPEGETVSFVLRGAATVEDRDAKLVEVRILAKRADRIMALAMEPDSGIEISRVSCWDPCKEAGRSWMMRGEPAWFGLVAYAAGQSGPIGTTVATWSDGETLVFERAEAPDDEVVVSVHGPLVGGWPSRIVTTTSVYDLAGVSEEQLEIPFPTRAPRELAASILDVRPFVRNVPPEGERLGELPLIEEAIAGAGAPPPEAATSWIQYGYSSMTSEVGGKTVMLREKTNLRIEAGTTATTIQGERLLPGLSLIAWEWSHVAEAIETTPDVCEEASIPLWDAARLAQDLGYVGATQYLLYVGGTECIVHIAGDLVDKSNSGAFIGLAESVTFDAHSGLLVDASLDPPGYLH